MVGTGGDGPHQILTGETGGAAWAGGPGCSSATGARSAIEERRRRAEGGHGICREASHARRERGRGGRADGRGRGHKERRGIALRRGRGGTVLRRHGGRVGEEEG